MNKENLIKQKALEIGFDLAGITSAKPVDSLDKSYLQEWLEKGFAGEMKYLHRNIDKRFDPSKLLDGAKSVICLAVNYRPNEQEHFSKEEGPTGRIADYAMYADYHDAIKAKLFELASFITSDIDNSAKFKFCVDSVPLAERSLAVRAGLGFIGKNHMLINPEIGSKILLGEIITDLQLSEDKPLEQSCVNCENCLSACPAGALDAEGNFDASKCISYLTIEYNGEIADNLAGPINDRLFGCDNCVDVCPFEKNIPICRAQWMNIKLPKYLNLLKISEMNEKEFNHRFENTALERTGLATLKRNAKICLKNQKT